MIVPTYEDAKRRAQANANSMSRPYAVFTDTSGNIRVERETSAPKDVECEWFQPEPRMWPVRIAARLWRCGNTRWLYQTVKLTFVPRPGDRV